MKKTAIIVAGENEFFARGKRLAASADAGKPMPSDAVISFGAPADLHKMLEQTALAGHSIMKRVILVAQKIRLQAELV